MKKFITRTRLNWVVDSILLISFIPLYFDTRTGRDVHQIIGIIFGIGVLYHVSLHWKWVLQVTKRFFKRQPKQTRINYFLNQLMFVDLIIVIYTGLPIATWFVDKGSPEFDQAATRAYYDMLSIHSTASWVLLALIGGHIWMHRKWIKSIGRRYWAPRWQRILELVDVLKELKNRAA
ncbi:MAG: cytochrome b/b6 domain-containing protein [Chloroflexota bacterium]